MAEIISFDPGIEKGNEFIRSIMLIPGASVYPARIEIHLGDIAVSAGMIEINASDLPGLIASAEESSRITRTLIDTGKRLRRHGADVLESFSWVDPTI